ncbi:hypothetical protein [Oceanobacillus alkalisoli]|uniref:hypothetical protein n=1 Tax=Oceanobacillus alkalisoli TaxID=2925113 RepID=UPI001EF08608|nr:hypothetical protein [Oceanobacillus alkalisoli]MCF3944826.1 hypothetical protein [Oceanobacillus alkalisoli]MCG5104748.1 hypothetical protein [Oceanobacillus alkalisoli]
MFFLNLKRFDKRSIKKREQRIEIKQAAVSDAAIIHHLMLQAFVEYKNETPSSNALEETHQSASNALETGEKALN